MRFAVLLEAERALAVALAEGLVCDPTILHDMCDPAREFLSIGMPLRLKHGLTVE